MSSNSEKPKSFLHEMLDYFIGRECDIETTTGQNYRAVKLEAFDETFIKFSWIELSNLSIKLGLGPYTTAFMVIKLDNLVSIRDTTYYKEQNELQHRQYMASQSYND